MVPEVRTKTVYKTRFRDVPKKRTESYWINVQEKRNRVVMTRVPKTVTRDHIRSYTVHVPYQVQVTVPRQVCRMVLRKVTIPLQECCDQCSQSFTDLHDASGAYLQYGAQQIGRAWNWVNEPNGESR